MLSSKFTTTAYFQNAFPKNTSKGLLLLDFSQKLWMFLFKVFLTLFFPMFSFDPPENIRKKRSKWSSRHRTCNYIKNFFLKGLMRYLSHCKVLWNKKLLKYYTRTTTEERGSIIQNLVTSEKPIWKYNHFQATS